MKKIILPDTALPIKDSYEHWIDINGDIYAINHRNNQRRYLYKKVQYITNGYSYCKIEYIIDNNLIIKSKRVNRIVAETFIKNPENKPLVCHRNNIKTDNRKDNLYWGTYSENTKQAFDDKLIINSKGYDDSQSKPVNMYNTSTNDLIKSFGSISEAHKETGIDKTTISRQCKYHRPIRKKVYFRFQDDEDCN